MRAKHVLRSVPLIAFFAACAGVAEARAACPSSSMRYASTSRRIYVTGPVACTLSDLDLGIKADVVQQVDPANRIWLLRASVVLEQGATLLLHGTAVGGDVNELRLLSNDSSTGTIYLRADWGAIDIDSTRVTSWDEAARGPDTRPSSNGRAFIHVRSRLAADGVTALESRMDIRDSDIGYLGHYAAESYGLVWKVAGTSAGLYDKVNVLGDVTDSRIHHNYFGAYTYGAYGMRWLRNEIAHNVKYGLDPHDDSDALEVIDNDFHHNGNHGFICSQRCDDLVIQGNRSFANTGNGFMLHRRVTSSIVEDNEAFDNTDSGIAIFDSSGNVVRNNVVYGNAKGIRLSVGSSDNLIEDNTISDNARYGIYFYKGSDAPTSGDGHPRRNTFLANDVQGNGLALKLTMGDENQFIGNTFADNGSGFELIDGLDNVFADNSIALDGTLYTKTSSLPTARTIVTQAPAPVKVRGAGGGVTIFREDGGPIHQVQGLTVATRVTSSEANLTLTSGLVSSARTVSSIPLTARTGSGAALVTPSSSTTWSARAESGTVTVSYTLGGLQASTTYTVRRDGAALRQVTSDGGGVISFSDSVGTGAVAYSVVR